MAAEHLDHTAEELALAAIIIQDLSRNRTRVSGRVRRGVVSGQALRLRFLVCVTFWYGSCLLIAPASPPVSHWLVARRTILTGSKCFARREIQGRFCCTATLVWPAYSRPPALRYTGAPCRGVSQGRAFAGSRGAELTRVGPVSNALAQQVPVEDCDLSLLRESEARGLAVAISCFEAAVCEAYATKNPSVLVRYLFELARAIHRAHHVLWVQGQPADVASARLLLFRVAREVSLGMHGREGDAGYAMTQARLPACDSVWPSADTGRWPTALWPEAARSDLRRGGQGDGACCCRPLDKNTAMDGQRIDFSWTLERHEVRYLSFFFAISYKSSQKRPQSGVNKT